MKYTKRHYFILNTTECIIFYEDDDSDIIFIEIENIGKLLSYSGVCDVRKCIELIENFIKCMEKIKTWHGHDHYNICIRNIATAYRLLSYIRRSYNAYAIIDSIGADLILSHQKNIQRKREEQKRLDELRRLRELRLEEEEKERQWRENNKIEWKSRPRCYRIDTEGMYSTSLSKIMDAYNDYCQSEEY